MRRIRISLVIFHLLFLSWTSAQLEADHAKISAAEALRAKNEAVRVKLEDHLNKITTYSAVVPKSGPPLSKSLTASISSSTSCSRYAMAANVACWEWASPEIAGFMKEYGVMLSGGLMIGTSMAKQCSDLSNALKGVSVALGLYQASCAAAQKLCETTCIKAQKSSGAAVELAWDAKAEASSKSSVVPNAAIAAQEFARTETTLVEVQKASTEQYKACQAHQLNWKSAAAGVGVALQGMMQARKCNDDTGSTAALDCSNPKSINYSTRNCQCARNELPMGECQGIRAPSAATPPGAIRGGAPSGLDGGPKGPVQLDTGGPKDNPLAGGGAPQGGPGAGAPGGGSGGGLGGAGTPGGASQDGQASGGRRLNTNVLGGFGGGGGAGMGGAGPGYGELDASLKAYGPGGAKDPNRKLASEFSRQVTAEAGRSNWEKVRARYKDNQRTLFHK
ncbi:MAG: hypothetical protein ACK5Y2_13020 [Bdellovibrionales bacterium]